jgi:5-methylcytosine-specific restriction endonuclease McrA
MSGISCRSAGIFKRDQGHCVQCDKDLTGVRAIEEAHYDHIIALAEYGTNDPANFQLFCRECNLRKGKKKWAPPESMLRFW